MDTTKRRIPFAKPSITLQEREAFAALLRQGVLTQGPLCLQFETAFRDYVSGDCFCIATSSCMAALHMAYLSLGIGPGDEVIVPAMTHVATVHAVELTGARPVFVDCSAESGNLDAACIERAVTNKTRAIALVHFLGLPCEMPEILAVAEMHGLRVIEDCALALGARQNGRHVGLFGDVGCFSFYPCKHITTGEGGMFVTKSQHLAELAKRIRGFGVDRTPEGGSGPGRYDVVCLGSNYRMNEMEACLGIGQIARAAGMLSQRRSNFQRLAGLLSSVEGITILGRDHIQSGGAAYCLSVLLSEERQHLRGAILQDLHEDGVEASVYYPQPVPQFTYYRANYGCSGSSYPNATRISDGSIALPVGPHVEAEDLSYIVNVLQKAIHKASR